MRTTKALTIRQGQVQIFPINLRTEFVNLLEIRKGTVRQLRTASFTFPQDDNVKGDPGGINDNDIQTALTCDRVPCFFPAIWVGNQHVARIDVSWRPGFAPVEYQVDGRNGLTNTWSEISGTHLPNVSAFHPAQGTDSFNVSAQWEWYRIWAKMMPVNAGQIELIDVRFFGIDETQETWSVAQSKDFGISQDSSGNVLIANKSGEDREISIQYDRPNLTYSGSIIQS